MEIRPYREARSPADNPASSMAILAAATENWLARPSSSIGRRLIHRAGSNSVTSQPLACAKPSVSNDPIGRAPLRPLRRPSANFSTPMPMLDTTPKPVSTTRRTSLPDIGSDD
jgi:hypothetical protein